MRLDVSAEIPFSRAEVFAVYRDKLPDLVKYLPNVRGISVTSRTDDGPVVKLLNRWKGGGEIPGMVRKFLSEDLLEWDDHAVWKQDSFSCDWRTIVPAFKDAIDAAGTNQFQELGPERTRLIIAGELKCDAAKIKGVPRLMSGMVGPAVETFLVATVKPNLISVAKGVEQFLREAKR
jgi:hypothetical protein